MTLSRTFRKLVVSTGTIVALLALTVTPAAAITDGAEDGNGHPYVALMLAKDANGDPLWRCSGTLMSPTVYLTAGHCTEAPAAQAEIFLDAGPIPTDPAYVSKAAGGSGCDDPAVTGYPCHGDVTGQTFTHPDYDPGAFFYRDLGIVVLDAPVALAEYGALPQLDTLDRFKTRRGTQDVTFTAVGYGLQKSFPTAAAWKNSAVKVRMVAYPKLNQINAPGMTGDYSLLLSNNARTGGTCFGDSGGPNFLGRSNVVAGVTSYGLNGSCGGTGGVFRVDRSWSLDWINSFLD
jgi:hypothetical protein